MSRFVLVVNAGSSTLKYSLVDPGTGDQPASGIVDRIGGPSTLTHTVGGDKRRTDLPCPDHGAALTAALDAIREHGPGLDLGDLLAVGHRVVHGGERFARPVVIDEEVIAAVEQLSRLAPLHNPPALAGIRAAQSVFAGVPQVAVFDTTFHQTMPPRAYTYAVPREWRTSHGIRRYGFHGTSIGYVSRRAAELIGRPVEELDLVVLHLGNGASACAVHAGESIDTSMGLSPVEGLVMGTRSGDLDPALAGYLARTAGLSAADFDEAISKRSGLLGLGGHSDFRDLEAARAAGDEDARLAYDVTVNRLVKYVGAYAAELGRVDAVVLTGGIGEHGAGLRAALLSRLGLLGIELDAEANARPLGDGLLLTTPDSRVQAWAVPTNEEWEIARQSAALIGTDAPSS